MKSAFASFCLTVLYLDGQPIYVHLWLRLHLELVLSDSFLIWIIEVLILFLPFEGCFSSVNYWIMINAFFLKQIIRCLVFRGSDDTRVCAYLESQWGDAQVLWWWLRKMAKSMCFCFDNSIIQYAHTDTIIFSIMFIKCSCNVS